MCRWTQTIYSYTCGCNWSSAKLDHCAAHETYLAAYKTWMKASPMSCVPEPVNKCAEIKSDLRSVYEDVDSVCDNPGGCPSRSR